MSLNLMPFFSSIWAFLRYTWAFLDSVVVYNDITLLDSVVAFAVVSSLCALFFSINKGSENDD